MADDNPDDASIQSDSSLHLMVEQGDSVVGLNDQDEADVFDLQDPTGRQMAGGGGSGETLLGHKETPNIRVSNRHEQASNASRDPSAS